jgi:hypothetical protein
MTGRTLQLTADQERELREYEDGEPRRRERRPSANLIRRGLLTLAPGHGHGQYRITEFGRAVLAAREEART